MAREAEYRQIIQEDTTEPTEDTMGPYGEYLSDEELDIRLREMDAVRSQIQIDTFVPAKPGEDKGFVMPVFQTEDKMVEEKRQLDIKG